MSDQPQRQELPAQALAAALELARGKGWQPVGLAAATGDEVEQLYAPWQQRQAQPHEPGPVFSGAGADERDPTRVGVAIPALAKQRQWFGRTVLADVLAAWPQMVGQQVAAHCQPEAVHEHTLTVRADSTAWATQMRLLSGSVLEAISRALELAVGDQQEQVVRQVRVLGPDAPSWSRGRLSVAGRGPRDTYG